MLHFIYPLPRFIRLVGTRIAVTSVALALDPLMGAAFSAVPLGSPGVAGESGPVKEKRQHRIPKNHQWKAEPGCKILVAERGVMRLDYPQSWVVQPQEGSIRIHDLEPPNDNCRVEVSVLRYPLVDVDSIPLESLVPELACSDVKTLRHHSFRLGWRLIRQPDPGSERPACSFLALALAIRIQVVLSMDCWEDDYERFLPVWETILRSLRLGQSIRDPVMGTTVTPGLN